MRRRHYHICNRIQAYVCDTPSTKSGILKTEAVLMIAKILLRSGISSFKDIEKLFLQNLGPGFGNHTPTFATPPFSLITTLLAKLNSTRAQLNHSAWYLVVRQNHS